MAGGVQVHVPAWDNDEDERDQRAFHLVVEIVSERLKHAASIGVLLNRNEDVSELTAILRSKGINVSEEGSGSIKSLPAVNAVLQLLHLADHPGDRSAAFLLSHSPLSSWLGLPPLESIPQDGQQDAMVRASLHVRTCVLREGLETVLAQLAELVRPKCDDRNAQALLHVVRLAGAWQGLVPQRLADFVQHVRQAKIESVTGGRVRVMTVHGAKGLEFDEVVLPLLDKAFVKESSGCLAVSDGPLGDLVAVAPSVHKKLRWRRRHWRHFGISRWLQILRIDCRAFTWR
jgi:ATP-dependent exoDNAse (exonuclease V) beta subunit